MLIVSRKTRGPELSYFAKQGITHCHGWHILFIREDNDILGTSCFNRQFFETFSWTATHSPKRLHTCTWGPDQCHVLQSENY